MHKGIAIGIPKDDCLRVSDADKRIIVGWGSLLTQAVGKRVLIKCLL
jgi:hypothetical protein